MTKLLSEQELKETFKKRLYALHGYDPGEVALLDAQIEDVANEFVTLTQSQKIAHADMVIGEDERIDVQSDFDKIDVPHLETDRYPGLDGVRQASRNLLRKWQRQRNHV